MSATPLGDAEFPGDAAAVQELAHTFETMAAGLRNQVDLLQHHLGNVGSWQGGAHDAFKNSVGPLPDNLDTAEKRYVLAAHWLRPYADTLGHSKNRAQQILDAMHGAQHRVVVAQSGLADRQRYEHTERARVQADPTGPPERLWAGPNHQSQLNQANSDLADLRGQLAALHMTFDECAMKTAAGVALAAELGKDLGGVKGWFEHRVADLSQAADKFGEFMDKYGFAFLEALSDSLSVVGTALAFAAFIPGIGTFVAGIGVALSLVSVAVDLALALGGRMSFGEWAVGAAFTLAPFALKGVGANLLAKAASKDKALAVGQRVSQTTLALSDDAGRSAARFDEAITASFKRGTNAVLGRAPLTGVHMTNLSVAPGSALLTGAAARSSIQKVVHLSPAGTFLYFGGVGVDKVGEARDLFHFPDDVVTLVDAASGREEAP